MLNCFKRQGALGAGFTPGRCTLYAFGLALCLAVLAAKAAHGQQPTTCWGVIDPFQIYSPPGVQTVTNKLSVQWVVNYHFNCTTPSQANQCVFCAVAKYYRMTNSGFYVFDSQTQNSGSQPCGKVGDAQASGSKVLSGPGDYSVIITFTEGGCPPATNAQGLVTIGPSYFTVSQN